MKVRTLIVDDEAPARQWLRALCGKHADIEIVGECSNVPQAAQRLRAGGLDLVLLDIQMGPHTGFQALDDLAAGSAPLVVFVTAFDRHAVRAFEKNAIDYLLKPVREDRFAATLDRVRRHLARGMSIEVRAALHAALGSLHGASDESRAAAGAQRIVAERGGAFHFIEACDVALIEANGNNVTIHAAAGGKPYSMPGTLQKVEALVDPASFLRISRSAVVNLAHVERIEREGRSAFCFVLPRERRVAVGWAYRSRVRELVRCGGRPTGTP